MTFKLVIRENAHYMVESEQWAAGTFESLELAIEAAKQIVDVCLADLFEPGMNAADLWSSYVLYGEDPFIDGPGTTHRTFSAWEYAEGRCEVMCRPD